KEKKELLGALGSLKGDIVAKSDAASAKPGKPDETADDPLRERSEGIREAATLLDKAAAARKKGSRNLAEQLFSAAELILGPEALASLAGRFREGAPPRVASALGQMPKDSPPQPALPVEANEAPPKPKMATLRGTVRFEGASGGMGVVTLEPVGKFRAATARRFIMEQRNRQFAPRLLVVPVDSTVAFPNF